MIIFDSNYLIAFLRPDLNQPPRDAEEKPVEHFQERIRELINDLNAKDVLVGVPTPVIAEILVKYPDHKADYLDVLRDRYRFEIMPFGVKAAIEASELIALLATETKQPAEQWAKVKFDIQIVAMAKAEPSLTMLYADDKGVVNNAKRLGIPVTRICELPLPTFRPAPIPVEDASGQLMLLEHKGNTNEEAPAETSQAEALTEPSDVQGRGDGSNGNATGAEQGEEGKHTPQTKATAAEAPVASAPPVETPKPTPKGGLGEDGH